MACHRESLFLCVCPDVCCNFAWAGTVYSNAHKTLYWPQRLLIYYKFITNRICIRESSISLLSAYKLPLAVIRRGFSVYRFNSYPANLLNRPPIPILWKLLLHLQFIVAFWCIRRFVCVFLHAGCVNDVVFRWEKHAKFENTHKFLVRTFVLLTLYIQIACTICYHP